MSHSRRMFRAVATATMWVLLELLIVRQGVSQQVDYADRDNRAAAAAILIMRVQFSEAPSDASVRYVIPPRVDSLELADAASVLARMPKPLVCAAVATGGLIELRCEGMGTGEWVTAVREIAREMVNGFVDQLQNTDGRALNVDERNVLLRVRGQSILVSMLDIADLIGNYVTGGIDFTLDPYDAEAQRSGARAALLVEPGGRVTVTNR